MKGASVRKSATQWLLQPFALSAPVSPRMQSHE